MDCVDSDRFSTRHGNSVQRTLSELSSRDPALRRERRRKIEKGKRKKKTVPPPPLPPPPPFKVILANDETVSQSESEGSGCRCNSKDLCKVAKIAGIGSLFPAAALLILYLTSSDNEDSEEQADDTIGISEVAIGKRIDRALATTRVALTENKFEDPGLANKGGLDHEINAAKLLNVLNIERKSDIILKNKHADAIAEVVLTWKSLRIEAYHGWAWLPSTVTCEAPDLDMNMVCGVHDPTANRCHLISLQHPSAEMATCEIEEDEHGEVAKFLKDLMDEYIKLYLGTKFEPKFNQTLMRWSSFM